MDEINWKEIEAIAIPWIKEAGKMLRNSLLHTIKVESKSNPDDLVTEMDRAVESFFLNKIETMFPNHSFLGEEGLGDQVTKATGTIWILDPIDGTTNFVHQQYNFAISLAVFDQGVGKVGIVYNVMAEELFTAVQGHGAYLNGERLQRLTTVPVNEAILGLNARWLLPQRPYQASLIEIAKSVRGIRSYGSAAIEICYVACGRLDGYISLKLSPWDFAAGIVLLEEVGANYTTINGNELALIEPCSVFVGKTGFHDEIIATYFKEG